MPNTIRSSKSKRHVSRRATVEKRDAKSGQFLIERVRVQKPPTQSEKVELRVSPLAKSRLQAAAAASRKTLSSFLLDSGLERADTVLADRTLFILNDEQWKAFIAMLEAPTRPRPRLARLLREPSLIE